MPSGGARAGAGRPLGSKNKTVPLVKELARTYTESAVLELARIAGLRKYADDAPIGKRGKMMPGSGSDQARIMAINTILDRGWGKATQPISGDEDGPPIQTQRVTRRIIDPLAEVTPDNDDDPLPLPDVGEEEAAKIA